MYINLLAGMRYLTPRVQNIILHPAPSPLCARRAYASEPESLPARCKIMAHVLGPRPCRLQLQRARLFKDAFLCMHRKNPRRQLHVQ